MPSCGYFSNSTPLHAGTQTLTCQRTKTARSSVLFFKICSYQCSSSVPFPLRFPLFSSIPLCLVQWRGEDGGRDGGWEEEREGGCVCGGGAFENSSSNGGVVVIQGVIQGDNEKTDKSTLISMWLIPSSAPPFFPACLLLSLPLPLPSSLSFFSHFPLVSPYL